MKSNQRGFSLIEVLVVIISVSLLGILGWLVFDRQTTKKTDDTKTNSATTEQGSAKKETPKTTDTDDGWKDGSFKYTKLSFKLPTNWQDISDNTKFQDGNTKYEEIVLKAPDGFVLTMSVNNLPRGYGGEEPNKTVLEFKDIDNARQWIITDNANGKVNNIYVGEGVKKVGEKILGVANTGRDGLNIELSGAYDYEFSSLASFNEKQSVKEAKLIFESLRF